jgi:uncharacterized MAPEG superfamily protein
MAQPEFTQAVAGVAATLALKNVAVHLATARARVKFNDYKHGALEWRADTRTRPVFKSLFKVLMLAQLPSYSVAALEQCAKNSAENEPFFLCLALAAAAAGPVAPWAAGAVKLFGAARCVHSAVLLSDALPQPARAVCYLAGLGATVALALAMLLSSSAKK